MAKYLCWRGDSLWCRYPIPEYPDAYPLGIKTTGSKTDRERAEKEGEKKLAVLRTKAIDGSLFEKKPEEKAPYRPKFWRLVSCISVLNKP
jgi:hypothetical protein